MDGGSALVAFGALSFLGGENASCSSVGLALDCDLDGFWYCGMVGPWSVLVALGALLLFGGGSASFSSPFLDPGRDFVASSACGMVMGLV